MQNHLKILTEILEQIDNNPQKTMQFITQAVNTTTIANKPPDNVRWLLLSEIMGRYAYSNLYAGDLQLTQQFVDDFLLQVNNKYQQHQNLCWRAHEHHFHVDFQEYVNCPITCICEIQEFLTKLGRVLYAG